MQTTLGWSLLLLVVFGVLTVRYLAARREGRLDRGIDPRSSTGQNSHPARLNTRAAVESATAKT